MTSVSAIFGTINANDENLQSYVKKKNKIRLFKLIIE